jgi:hypothetical protein
MPRKPRLFTGATHPIAALADNATMRYVSLMQKPEICHPERSDPKGRAVEGSPKGMYDAAVCCVAPSFGGSLDSVVELPRSG